MSVVVSPSRPIFVLLAVTAVLFVGLALTQGDWILLALAALQVVAYVGVVVEKPWRVRIEDDRITLVRLPPLSNQSLTWDDVSHLHMDRARMGLTTAAGNERSIPIVPATVDGAEVDNGEVRRLLLDHAARRGVTVTSALGGSAGTSR